MDLNKGEYININEDGSGTVKDKNNKTILTILKPWAVDNNQKELKTWYTVNGNNLVQHIDFENATFPVIADPTWCGKRFHSVIWIYRSGLWSASINPTWCGAWFSGTYSAWSAWEEVYNIIPYHNSWTYPKRSFATNSYWSMYNQFVCHADWPGGLKTPWNLEPQRPDKGYAGFVIKGCN